MGCEDCKITYPRDWKKCQKLRDKHTGVSPCGAIDFKSKSNYTPPKKKRKRKK